MALKGRTKKDVVAEFRHEEILAAARRVFAEKGFRESAMDEIAQAAGVAKGTLYLYYPSKEAIYQAALQHGLKDLAAELRARVEKAEGLREKVRAFVSTKVEHFAEHRDFFRIYYAELGASVSHPACAQGWIKDLYLDQLGMLKHAVSAAVAAGEVRALDPALTACAIFDLTKGAISQRLLGWSRRPLAEEVEAVVDLAWKGLGGR